MPIVLHFRQPDEFRFLAPKIFIQKVVFVPRSGLEASKKAPEAERLSSVTLRSSTLAALATILASLVELTKVHALIEPVLTMAALFIIAWLIPRKITQWLRAKARGLFTSMPYRLRSHLIRAA